MNHPNIIDLDHIEKTYEVDEILSEIGVGAKEMEDQVAYRRHQRYVPRLLRFRQQIPEEETITIRSEATYLITGGTGDLGRLTAHWLVDQGAKHLVLLSRHGASPEAEQDIEGLRQKGAYVFIKQADVAEQSELQFVITEIQQTLPPLRGIIHAAGILDDGIVSEQRWDRFMRVFRPKIQGTWNLHTLTQNLPLDLFVMFSSAASILGGPGQVNYAAANAFLDALIHYRRFLGLTGISINWGAWENIGMAARVKKNTGIDREGIGVKGISPKEGIALISHLFSLAKAQVAVMHIDWERFMERQAVVSPFFESFTVTYKSSKRQRYDVLSHLQATPINERQAFLLNYIKSMIAQLLGFDTLSINNQKGFFEIGMDSLTALELRNILQNDLGCFLPASLAFDYPTIDALMDFIIREVFPSEFKAISLEKPIFDQQARQQDREQIDIEKMSDDEAEEMLLHKLENQGF